MTSTFYWLTVQEVGAIHDDLVKEMGGSLGLLDAGALESTLNRPKQLIYYEPESSIYDLAATYGYGLVKNHAFVDENKRTALDVMAVFLIRNEYELVASEVEAVEVIVDLAKGELSQTELSMWLVKNVEKLYQE